MAKKVRPQPGDAFIVARGLGQKLPGRSSYENVDLDIPFGSFGSVVAESGEGKTELLLTLAGRMRFTTGTLTVAGYNLPWKRSRVRRISGMGFFDRVNEVQPVLSVAAVVAAELNLYSKRSGGKAVRAFLEEWGFQDLAHRKIETLGRMSYVRLGIALGLVGDPWLLVIDDIESDLTRHQSIQLMEELEELARTRNVTVLVACTDYDLALHADVVFPISEAARAQARAVSLKAVEPGQELVTRDDDQVDADTKPQVEPSQQNVAVPLQPVIDSATLQNDKAEVEVEHD